MGLIVGQQPAAHRVTASTDDYVNPRPVVRYQLLRATCICNIRVIAIIQEFEL